MIFALVMFLGCPDMEARVLIENPTSDQYVNRADSIRMDDNFPLREALKRQAVSMKLMSQTEAAMFDEGFGACHMALGYLRQQKAKPKVLD